MNIHPTGDHIVILPIQEQETTAAGIFVPDAAKDQPERGTVLAVGPGRILSSGNRALMDVQVGNTVLFKKYAPDEFTIDGDKVFVVRAEDVIAIIE